MQLGYTILYVTDVLGTLAFYEAAFALSRRFVHESDRYAELDTGSTTLAFVGEEAAALHGFTVAPNRRDRAPAGFELCFLTSDVAGAYERALQHGAVPLSAPETKPWGQIVAYVRDCNGCLVELATPIGGDELV
jgi:catechol 2,3-dioxygenase-like lactoylglutathione lyase family enzyme